EGTRMFRQIQPELQQAGSRRQKIIRRLGTENYEIDLRAILSFEKLFRGAKSQISRGLFRTRNKTCGDSCFLKDFVRCPFREQRAQFVVCELLLGKKSADLFDHLQRARLSGQRNGLSTPPSITN